MSAASGEHGQEHSERLALYAVRALPSSAAAVVAAHVAECPACTEELDGLRPVVDAFCAWPTDLLRPSDSVWARLVQRLAAETDGEPLAATSSRCAEPEWHEVVPGAFRKILVTNLEQDRVSMLVRIAPGTQYPSHRHHDVEELYLLHGEIIIDDERFYAGDYRRAEPGTADHNVWTDTGCTCLLITSLHDILPG